MHALPRYVMVRRPTPSLLNPPFWVFLFYSIHLPRYVVTMEHRLNFSCQNTYRSLSPPISHLTRPGCCGISVAFRMAMWSTTA